MDEKSNVISTFMKEFTSPDVAIERAIKMLIATYGEEFVIKVSKQILGLKEESDRKIA